MALVETTRTITIRRNPCAVTLKEPVTDRARYRANQPACQPAGPKKCARCASTRFLTIDHKDGNESNGAKSNLSPATRNWARGMRRTGREDVPHSSIRKGPPASISGLKRWPLWPVKDRES